jgi:very-short-patch-repair endonuclease
MAAVEPVREPNPRRPSVEWGVEHNNRVHEPKLPVAAAVWAAEQVRGRGDREISRIADVQKGFAQREQLFRAGFGRGSIAYRLSTGRLRERYRGVYLVDRLSPDPLGEEWAAVLYFGGHAVLSHRSAAAIWGLLGPIPGEVNITAVGVDRRSRKGLRVHRAKRLDRRDLRSRDGLPVTSPPRTIVDLASDPDLEEALAVALQRDLAGPREIQAAMARTPRCTGAARLRALLEHREASGLTRSWTERRMRALLRRAELPQPVANAPLLGYVADFLWPEYRLIVEVDGFNFHSSRSAFEHDRRRDQKLAAAGYTVIRVTRRQLMEEPYAVIARIAQAIAARTS